MATEILAYAVDSCFETTNMMYTTSGEAGLEKYGGKEQSLPRDRWEGFTVSKSLIYLWDSPITHPYM